MKKRIQNMDVKNKRVLLRCDFNVPIEEERIIDDSKIVASLPTIEYLIENEAKIIILSHFGKVKTEEDKKKNSLRIVARHLQKILNRKVIFCKQTRNLLLESKTLSLAPGEILFLENTRFEDIPNKLESNNDPQLSLYWSSLADIYCLDAFGSSHRKHASTYGVAKYLPSCIGFLVQKEIEMLDKHILHAEKPFVIVMGGAKVEDKISLIESLLPKCDSLIMTGGIANSCLHALGFSVGNSLRTKDEEILKRLKEILIKNKDKIILPLDAYVGRDYDPDYVKHLPITKIEEEDIISDIGNSTIEKCKPILNSAKTIFINGTAGKYEDHRFASGTRELLSFVASLRAVKLVGGGDGVSAVKYFHLENSFDFLSTGGGATLEYIIEGGLPAINNIEEE